MGSGTIRLVRFGHGSVFTWLLPTGAETSFISNDSADFEERSNGVKSQDKRNSDCEPDRVVGGESSGRCASSRFSWG